MRPRRVIRPGHRPDLPASAFGSPLRYSPGRGSCAGAFWICAGVPLPADRPSRPRLRCRAEQLVHPHAGGARGFTPRSFPWSGRLRGDEAAPSPHAVLWSSASIVFIEVVGRPFANSRGVPMDSVFTHWAADRGFPNNRLPGLVLPDRPRVAGPRFLRHTRRCHGFLCTRH